MRSRHRHGIELAYIREHTPRLMRHLAAFHREVEGECSVTRLDYAKGYEMGTESDGALAMLQADHHTIRRLFQSYETTNDQALRRRIAADVFTVLERHTALEDTVLYAAFAVASDEEGERLLGEAFRAHQLCALLVEELCELAPDDAMFAQRWHALRDQIEPHMDQEERELFPQAARLLAAEMGEITVAMQEIQEPILVS
jgi:hemerythrin-like domain-containing protein